MTELAHIWAIVRPSRIVCGQTRESPSEVPFTQAYLRFNVEARCCQLVPMEAAYLQLVARRIESARIAAGFSTKDELARSAGITRSSISRIIDSHVDVRLSTLVRIADALGVPVHKLLEPDGSGPIGTQTPTKSQRLKPPPPKVTVEVKVVIPAGAAQPSWLQNAFRDGSAVLSHRKPQGRAKKGKGSPRSS